MPRSSIDRRAPAARATSLVLLLALIASGAHADAAPPPSSPAIIEEVTTDFRSIGRFWRFPYSARTLDRTEATIATQRERLNGIDFAPLDPSTRVDLVLLRLHLDELDTETRSRRTEREELLELIPFHDTVVAVEEERWSTPWRAPEESATTLAELERQVRDAISEVTKAVERDDAARARPATETQTTEDGPAPAPRDDARRGLTARRAIQQIDVLRRALNSWYESQKDYVPGFSWWIERPKAALDASLEELAKLLRDRVPGAQPDPNSLEGIPIGRDALLAALEHEMLPYSPEELLEIARRELEWCRAEQIAASRELGFGEDWRAALEEVKRRHVAPGRQAELVFEQAHEAIRFLDERDLVTIPPLCRDTWRWEMISTDGQRTLPYAAYGGQHVLIAYSTESMSHESKQMSMRGNNIHFTRIVTPHELIPGHHLQGFQAARLNAHRREFSTPFLVEGWALYWERRLWNLGWARGPEDRLGMLFWRMHRCARITVSLGFHLMTMSPDEMVEFLVREVGHEKDAATSEVRRYIGDAYGPLYQCAYMIGGLQLEALHGELVAAGRMTEREFHDAILAQNAIPVELIRAVLTDQELALDHRAAWRFYPDLARRAEF